MDGSISCLYDVDQYLRCDWHWEKKACRKKPAEGSEHAPETYHSGLEASVAEACCERPNSGSLNHCRRGKPYKGASDELDNSPFESAKSTMLKRGCV